MCHTGRSEPTFECAIVVEVHLLLNVSYWRKVPTVECAILVVHLQFDGRAALDGGGDGQVVGGEHQLQRRHRLIRGYRLRRARPAQMRWMNISWLFEEYGGTMLLKRARTQVNLYAQHIHTCYKRNTHKPKSKHFMSLNRLRWLFDCLHSLDSDGGREDVVSNVAILTPDRVLTGQTVIQVLPAPKLVVLEPPLVDLRGMLDYFSWLMGF